MKDIRSHGGFDTGILLDEAYAFCGAAPSEAMLVDWAERALAFARSLDEGKISGSFGGVLEEICALVETHPASFAAAAPWAEAQLERGGMRHALLLLDALASAPEREAMDADEADFPAMALEEALAKIPPAKIEHAEEAIFGARAWQAQVHELFERSSRDAGFGALITLEAKPHFHQEEDHVLLGRFGEGELLLTRNKTAIWADWYGGGEPGLYHEAEELPHRPLPQGEGRRWPLPAQDPPFTLRLRLGAVDHSIRIPGEDEEG